MNALPRADRTDKLPGISTLDLDSTLHMPPAPSNSSAPEAAEKIVRGALEYPPAYWINHLPTMESANIDYATPPSAPATRFTPDNAESKQLETGSYDTTRSTYFYPDNTWHLDILQRDQTPTTRRPQLPLSPTTRTAEPRWRNISDSRDVFYPAMKSSAMDPDCSICELPKWLCLCTGLVRSVT
jgi:hypothetical protein